MKRLNISQHHNCCHVKILKKLTHTIFGYTTSLCKTKYEVRSQTWTMIVQANFFNSIALVKNCVWKVFPSNSDRSIATRVPSKFWWGCKSEGSQGAGWRGFTIESRPRRKRRGYLLHRSVTAFAARRPASHDGGAPWVSRKAQAS